MDYSVNEIKITIKKLEKQLNECNSDFGFWSIQRDLDYWRQILYLEENK